MASSSSCLRLENVILSSTFRKLRQTNANGSVLPSSPISSFSRLSPSSSLFSAILKTSHSLSCSLSVKASSSTVIAEPEGIKINLVPTKPIEGQKTRASGLRKKVKVFMDENYLANWIQALLNSLPAEDYKIGVLVLGGDGSCFNQEASQIINKIAAGNGVGKIPVGKESIMSMPAVSAVIRKRKARTYFSSIL